MIYSTRILPDIKGCLLILFALLLSGIIIGETNNIRGTVTDPDGQPIAGSSVMLCVNDSILNGQATDIEGRFTIDFADSLAELAVLKISAIGYESGFYSLASVLENNRHDFSLAVRAVELSSVKVATRPTTTKFERHINRSQIIKSGRTGIVPTNPISAIKQPQVIRQGSSFSSKIRVSGTNPRYYLNGIDIGQDPNHYGIFTILPGSALDNIMFYGQGTSARLGQPGAVELTTPRAFNSEFSGSFDFSLVEATGTAQYGSDNYFFLTSIRKSVLDKLVNYLDVESDRQTLPPTNFRDIFASGGWRLGNRTLLSHDQYHSNDYLSYRSDATASNPEGINIFQHTAENYYNLNLKSFHGSWMHNFSLAYSDGEERYISSPQSSTIDVMQVNLEGSRKNFITGLTESLVKDNYRMEFGLQMDYTFDREINLTQQNWNFNSIDAVSDQPYLYQQELNQLYGSYSAKDKETNGAGFVTWQTEWQGFDIENGIRVEYFGNLKDRRALLHRHKISRQIGNLGRAEIFYGTFAENPAGPLLEAYQVIIHDYLETLSPTRSRLLSVKFETGPLVFSFFAKKITDLTLIVPDFNYVSQSGEVSDGFISAQSIGKVHFYGGDISFEIDRFFSTSFDISGFYGYSHAGKNTLTGEVLYDLNAEHAINLTGSYHFSNMFEIGGDFNFRSGYHYTPYYDNSAWLADDRYSLEFYQEFAEQENSVCFPDHVSFNLRLEYTSGPATIFLTLSNITNAANPIISTRDGYIYDAGIMPTMGVHYSF